LAVAAGLLLLETAGWRALLREAAGAGLAVQVFIE